MPEQNKGGKSGQQGGSNQGGSKGGRQERSR